MADYTVIEDTEIDPEAPITSFLAFRFRDNPEAMAERAVNATQIIPEILDLQTGSGNFIVPAGVTRLRVTMVGGGGGSNGSTGGGGGGVIIHNLTVTPAQSIAFGVGAGGAANVAGGDTTFGALTAGGGGPGSSSGGGSAAGGDINLPGTAGLASGTGHDLGGSNVWCSGPTKEDTVGNPFGGGGGGGSFAGADGTIILEY